MKIWQPDEDKILAKVYPHMQMSEMVKMFGCIAKSIRARASRLKIGRAKDFNKALERPDHWTPEADALLTQHYPHVQMPQLIRILKRSQQAIMSRAYVLRIRRDEKFSRSLERPAVVAQAMEFSKRPEGFKVSQLTGDRRKNSKIVFDMVKTGALAKLTISFKDVRYFGSIKQVDAYRVKGTRAAAVTIKHTGQSRAWWKPDAPMYFPPNYKHTIIETKQQGFHTSTHLED